VPDPDVPAHWVDSAAPATTGRADAQRNRSAIVGTALRVFGRQPGASVSSVADAAGLSRATVYRHFPNRGSLEAAIREEALAAAAAVLVEARLDDGRALPALERAVHGLVRLGPRFGVLLLDGAASAQPFLQQRDKVFQPLQETVRRAREEGDLDRAVDERWAYQALTALLVAAARVSGAAGVEPDRAASWVCRTYVRGLASPSRRRRARQL
jgi:AcrR family transcriptional regulator